MHFLHMSATVVDQASPLSFTFFLLRSRFLQGPGTDPNTVSVIRDAIKTGTEITVRILNYTKSGRPFWNMFTLAPMRGGYPPFHWGQKVQQLLKPALP
jgi:hypothetical protein